MLEIVPMGGTVETKDATQRTNNIPVNLLLIAIVLILDSLAIGISISMDSLGWTIAAAILACVGLYALCHDILVWA